MKRLLSILLILMMIGMVGCGKHPGHGGDDDPDATRTTEQVATEQAHDETHNANHDATQEAYNPDEDYNLDHTFKNHWRLDEHYEKHGEEMGFDSPEEYEWAADQVVHNPNALHKTEREDGDDVYYVEDTNEFVIVSKDGYIRTYFEPDRGIAYYNKQ